MTDETYLPPKEFALLSGVCVVTVYRWLSNPKIRTQLKAERRGPKLWLIPQSEVLRVKRG